MGTAASRRKRPRNETLSRISVDDLPGSEENPRSRKRKIALSDVERGISIAIGNGGELKIVASRNAVSKNGAIQEISSRRISAALLIPRHWEEAAFGAALRLGVEVDMLQDWTHGRSLIL